MFKSVNHSREEEEGLFRRITPDYEFISSSFDGCSLLFSSEISSPASDISLLQLLFPLVEEVNCALAWIFGIFIKSSFPPPSLDDFFGRRGYPPRGRWSSILRPKFKRYCSSRTRNAGPIELPLSNRGKRVNRRDKAIINSWKLCVSKVSTTM